VPEEYRVQLKQSVLDVCCRQEYQFKQKALCMALATISAIEFKDKSWPECLSFLSSFAMQEDFLTKKAGMMALSYVCENLHMADYPSERDAVVAAILSNMDLKDEELMILALKAFDRAGLVTHEHFQDAQKRDFILQNLMGCFSSSNNDIHKHVFSILNEISYMIYQYIPDYLQKIGDATVRLLKEEGCEGEATMALEFWISLCYYEQDFPSENTKIIFNLHEALLGICFIAFEQELES
jgi:importin subunit beta-1